MSETFNRPRFLRLLIAFAALALLAGACGGEDDDSDEAAPQAADDESTGADAEADEEPEPAADDSATPEDETDPPDETEADDEAAGDGDEGESNGDDDAGAEPAETTTTTEAPATTAPPESTTTLPAETGLPPEEERGENEAGVRIDLDETATLTCANAEFARDALRTEMLDAALEYTAAAADRAEPSAVVELAELVPEMRAAQTAAEIESVIDEALAICVERGHQI